MQAQGVRRCAAGARCSGPGRSPAPRPARAGCSRSCCTTTSRRAPRPGGTCASAVSSSSTVQPVDDLAWTVGEVKPSARPLVWLSSWRMVIWSPLGTPAIHLAMWSSSDTLPSPTSCRIRLAVNVLVWLAILNCMSVLERRSGRQVGDAASPSRRCPSGSRCRPGPRGSGSSSWNCRTTRRRAVATVGGIERLDRRRPAVGRRGRIPGSSRTPIPTRQRGARRSSAVRRPRARRSGASSGPRWHATWWVPFDAMRAPRRWSGRARAG